MKEIIIESLYKNTGNANDFWEYNQAAERLITETFITNEQGGYSQSQGNAPEYDIVTYEGASFEIKVQSTQDCFLEFEQKKSNGFVPSGISRSKADYYLMINPGWSRILGKQNAFTRVGKARIFRRSDLIALLGCSDVYKEFKGNEYGKGSRGLFFKSDGVDHLWLGDIMAKVREKDSKVVEYDFTRIYKNFKEDNIHEILEEWNKRRR